MKAISSINDLQHFDEALWEITKGLPLRTGSIFRVPSEAYARWGILLNQENKEWLRQRAEFFYLKDAHERAQDRDVRRLYRTPQQKAVEEQMAQHIGLTVKELLKSIAVTKGSVSICDLGARHCQLACEIATSVRNDSDTESLADRITFHIVHSSAERLDDAKRQMDGLGLKCEIHPKPDRAFIESYKGMFEVVVSLCHFNRRPFTESIAEAASLLYEGGVLVSGDWHSTLWDHPINAYNLLKRIGAENGTLDSFKNFFGLECMAPDFGLKPALEEIQAMENHFSYWEEVARNVRGAKGFAIKPKIHFLQATDTSERRRQKLEESGLSTDIEKIRIAFPKSRLDNLPKRMIRNSDYAVVMAGLKQHGNGKG